MKKYGNIPIPAFPLMKLKMHLDTGEPLILAEEEKEELRTALEKLKSEKPNRRTPKDLIRVQESLIKMISLALERAE